MNNKNLLTSLFVLFLPLPVLAQVNLFPKNTGSNININVGLQAASLDLKKGEFAARYENNNDLKVVSHSLSVGLKAGIEKEFRKTPIVVSLQYFTSNTVASFVGDNEVDLVKNPIEQVFLFVSSPRERNVTSARQFTLTLKTTLLSTSLRKRTSPGIYLYLVSGIGRANYEGEEVVFLDPPFQEIASWKEEHTSLNLGGELAVFPFRKNNGFSFLLTIEKQYLPDPQRFEGSITTFSYGFKISL